MVALPGGTSPPPSPPPTLQPPSDAGRGRSSSVVVRPPSPDADIIPDEKQKKQFVAPKEKYNGHLVSKEQPSKSDNKIAQLILKTHAEISSIDKGKLKDHIAKLKKDAIPLHDKLKELEKVDKESMKVSLRTAQMDAKSSQGNPKIDDMIKKYANDIEEFEVKHANIDSQLKEKTLSLSASYLRLDKYPKSDKDNAINELVQDNISMILRNPDLCKLMNIDPHQYITKNSSSNLITKLAEGYLTEKKWPPASETSHLIIREMHKLAITPGEKMEMNRERFIIASSTVDFKTYGEGIPAFNKTKLLEDLAKDCLNNKKLPPASQLSAGTFENLNKSLKKPEDYERMLLPDKKNIHKEGIPDYLSPASAKKINEFIRKNAETFINLKEGEQKFEKHSDEKGLPRSLLVYKEGGQVFIMVFLKTKGADNVKNSELFKASGADKSVKRAIDWASGKEFAQFSLKESKNKAKTEGEIKLHKGLSGGPGISTAATGYGEHPSVDKKGKPVQVTHFFQPFYKNGILSSFIMQHLGNETEPLTDSIKYKLIDGVFDSGLTARQNRVLHNDRKGDNYFMSDTGEPLLADFGESLEMPPNGQIMSTRELARFNAGNQNAKAPELRLLNKLASRLDEMIDKTVNIPRWKEELDKSKDKLLQAISNNNQPEIDRLKSEVNKLENDIKKHQELKDMMDTYGTKEACLSNIMSPLYHQCWSKFENYSVGLEVLGILSGQYQEQEGIKENLITRNTSGLLEQVIWRISDQLTPDIVMGKEGIELTPRTETLLKTLLGENNKFKIGPEFPKSYPLHEILDACINKVLKDIDKTKMSPVSLKLFNQASALLSADPSKRMSLEEGKDLLKKLKAGFQA